MKTYIAKCHPVVTHWQEVPGDDSRTLSVCSLASAPWELTRTSPGQCLEGTRGAASLDHLQDNSRRKGPGQGQGCGPAVFVLFKMEGTTETPQLNQMRPRREEEILSKARASG